MFVMMKKKPVFDADLQTMLCKIREIMPKKCWKVTYSTNKEDRLCTEVFADTYTSAYLAFMSIHKSSDEITEIKEV
jgi:hypothetical protein